MAFLERGSGDKKVRLHYEEHGTPSGLPLLLISPGGMNSTIGGWSRMAVFNPLEQFANDFRMVAMDQRNSGESTGPLETEDPWGEFIADQTAIMDHLGINRFAVLGHCIGCSYNFEHIKRHPERIACAVMVSPIGKVDDNRDRLSNGIWQGWGETLLQNRPELTKEALEQFGRKMWWDHEFVISVNRVFAMQCTTPMIVFPGNDPAHPLAIGREVGTLPPNATLVEPWRDTPEMVQQSAMKARDFIKQHA